MLSKNINKQVAKIGKGVPVEISGFVRSIKVQEKINFLGNTEQVLVVEVESQLWGTEKIEVIIPLLNIRYSPLYLGLWFTVPVITTEITQSEFSDYIDDISWSESDSAVEEAMILIEYLGELFSSSLREMRIGLNCSNSFDSNDPVYYVSYLWPQDEVTREKNEFEWIRWYEDPTYYVMWPILNKEK